MPEWRKIFEAEDSDLPDLGAMEVCSSTEMGAPGASHLGTGGHGPKTDRSRPRSVPVNAPVFGYSSRIVGDPEVGRLCGRRQLVIIAKSLVQEPISADMSCVYRCACFRSRLILN
jgi:hypothetical protein